MRKTSIILDCDPGHDDAIALLMALASDKVNLLGITTVGGNQTLEKVTRNTLQVLELVNKTDIPVVSGRQDPLFSSLSPASQIHGESGLNGPILKEPTTKAKDMNACDFIAKCLKESDEKVVICAVGPLTNIGAFVLSYPDLLDKVESFVIMGGGVYEGSRTPTAEFNVWQDPEAAKIVFNSGVYIHLFGLDVTHKNLVYPSDIEKFAEGGKVSGFIKDLMDFYAHTYMSVRKFNGCPIHDACAVAHIIDPTIFKGEEVFLDCEIESVVSRGSCIVDLRPLGRRIRPLNATVYFDVDREKFMDLLYKSCEILDARVKEEN